MTTEFSRVVALDTIGAGGRDVAIDADSAERGALARRFGWVRIDRLSAAATLTARAGGVDATGRLSAAIVQPCVVTGEGVPAAIAEDFALRFVAAAHAAPDGDEVELGDADLDVLPIEGGGIDLGEAVAQTLALAANPWPRSANADTALREAGVLGEGEAGPFAALKDLLKRE